jgi:hypothetical protein
MKTLRIILGFLLVIPLGLLTYHFSLPLTEYIEEGLAAFAYFVFGIPILIFNIWVWGAPRSVEDFLFGKEEQSRKLDDELNSK